MMLLVSFTIHANDSIQLVLESKDIATDDFQVVGDTIELSEQQLSDAFDNLLRRQLILEYIESDHDSERGKCLVEVLPVLFKKELPKKINSIIPHCIFDDENFTFGPATSHALQHRRDVVKVKKVAFYECNKNNTSNSLNLAVFTGPQNLVDILYHVNTPNLTYTIHDGSRFYCLSSNL